MPTCFHCLEPLQEDKESFNCLGCSTHYPFLEGIPSFVDEGIQVAGYRKEFFKLFREQNSSDRLHFWFRARNEIILSLYRTFAPSAKGQRFLEVGCGTGAVLEHFIKNGINNVEGADIFPEALRICRAQTGARVWLADARKLPFLEEFDAVGLFDCLEHILEEKTVLNSVKRVLRPDGIFLLTVPAGPHLWTQLDNDMGHFRRYTKLGLKNILNEVGLKVLKISHFNFFLLPSYWLHRFWILLFNRLKKSADNSLKEAFMIPPFFLNQFLYYVMRSEKWLLPRCVLPFGSSLIAITRKP